MSETEKPNVTFSDNKETENTDTPVPNSTEQSQPESQRAPVPGLEQLFSSMLGSMFSPVPERASRGDSEEEDDCEDPDCPAHHSSKDGHSSRSEKMLEDFHLLVQSHKKLMDSHNDLTHAFCKMMDDSDSDNDDSDSDSDDSDDK